MYLKIIFLISQPKHMQWVLKRTVSLRRFFENPEHMFELMGNQNIHNFTLKNSLPGPMQLSYKNQYWLDFSENKISQ